MNVALVGLTTREEVALGMLVGKSQPGWQCSAVTAGLDESLPPADLYVVDLAGRGMRRWTEEAQSDLLKALDGAPAVLVAPAFDQTWSALDSHLMKSQSLVLLHKPYGTEDMRAALKQAAAGRATPVQPKALPVAPPAPHGVLPPASAPRVIASPVMAAMSPSPPVAQEDGKMTAGEFQARPGAFPGHEPPLFMRMLGEALALHNPFEVRVSFLNRMIFHPDAQWMASNTPLPVLEDLCGNDALASSVEIDTIDDKDAMARALRLGMPIEPLESFLWKLAHEQLDKKA
ncbi:hypothetical protein [Polaromonas hydrogenivorans]|uniref:Uncharacterized protein n=1 Tax=Polaromonas hydrogenivorans TaxID=335476 RepID=A0AAU7LV61_9BURK